MNVPSRAFWRCAAFPSPTTSANASPPAPTSPASTAGSTGPARSSARRSCSPRVPVGHSHPGPRSATATPTGRSAVPQPRSPPGDYDVYVLQYELPAGVTSQQYTLWTYGVGQGTPAVTPTVTPAEQRVSPGDHPEITLTWPGATKGERYMGVVEFGDGKAVTGRTQLSVTP